MPTGDCQAVLAELAVESWRFAKEYRRLVLKLDANEQNRFANKLNYFLQRLQSCLAEGGLNLVSLEGQPYEMGIAADVLNLDEYSPGDDLVIDQMIEPVIMGPDGIVKTGKALVRRARTSGPAEDGCHGMGLFGEPRRRRRRRPYLDPRAGRISFPAEPCRVQRGAERSGFTGSSGIGRAAAPRSGRLLRPAGAEASLHPRFM